MNNSQTTQKSKPTDPVGHWLGPNQSPVNADFSRRIVELPADALWLPSGQRNIMIRILEYIPGPTARLTAQLHLRSTAPDTRVYSFYGAELLLQRGQLIADNKQITDGQYLRYPLADARSDCHSTLRFAAVGSTSEQTPETQFSTTKEPLETAELYLSVGQFAQTDTECRRIDTTDESRWLPGPVAGTEVMPLHLHGKSNSMLVRWTQAAAFQPRLDPLGEEVLVLSGLLRDVQGEYPKGTWIRNPVPAWQAWAGSPGTVVYYKNGHFDDPVTGQHEPDQQSSD